MQNDKLKYCYWFCNDQNSTITHFQNALTNAAKRDVHPDHAPKMAHSHDENRAMREFQKSSES